MSPLWARKLFSSCSALQSAMENLLVHRQVVGPRRTKRIEHTRGRERFHTVRNIARQIERIAR